MLSPTRLPHALLCMVDNASQQTVMRRLRHKAVIIIVSLCNEVGSASLMSSDLYACQVCTSYFMRHPAIVLTVQSVPMATYWTLQTDRAFFSLSICAYGTNVYKAIHITHTSTHSQLLQTYRVPERGRQENVRSARSPIQLTFQWITWKNRSCLFNYTW